MGTDVYTFQDDGRWYCYGTLREFYNSFSGSSRLLAEEKMKRIIVYMGIPEESVSWHNLPGRPPDYVERIIDF